MARNLWLPITGGSVEEIISAHADPLALLESGAVPALVVRRALAAPALTTVLSRLQGQPWQRRTASYKTLGVDLGAYLGRYPHPLDLLRAEVHSTCTKTTDLQRHHANATAAFDLAAKRAGLYAPVEALHRTLRALLAARSAAAEADFLPAPGVFRMHRPGNRFAPHADTIHAAEWSSACGGKRPRRGVAPNFRPLRRLRHQLSALVSLQQPRSGGELRIFSTNWEALMSTCNQRGVAYDVGIAFPHWPRAAAMLHPREYNLTVTPGDVFIFNSNRVHEVLPVVGQQPRLVLGSFVGYSHSPREEMRMCLEDREGGAIERGR